MELFHLNSLYAAVFVLCTFIVTVLFICCKLARQDSRIEAIYQPQVRIPHRSVAKLRKKPRSKSNPSRAIGTQTLNVNVLYAAFKKESVPSKPTISETPDISSVEEKEVKLETVELFTNSEHFYANPSLAYETVADIHRPSAIYTRVPH